MQFHMNIFIAFLTPARITAANCVKVQMRLSCLENLWKRMRTGIVSNHYQYIYTPIR